MTAVSLRSGTAGTYTPDSLFLEYAGESSPVFLGGTEKRPQYLTRVNPLTGDVSRISRERAEGARTNSLGIDVSLDITPVKHCMFCNYLEEGAQPQIYHEDGTVSMMNPFPWESEMWVSAYPPFDPQNSGHKLLLSDMVYGDMDRMISSERDIARRFYEYHRERPDVFLSMRDFTNWGPFAGASQQHPHSQRPVTTYVLPPVETRELEKSRKFYMETGVNIFDALIHTERQDGRRVIHDDGVFISAAFAPKYNDEVIVVPKDPVTNVLQMDDGYMRKIMRPALGIFPALFFYRGVRNLNIAVHQAPFASIDSAESYYRWHMHITPRKEGIPTHVAGAEIGYDENIVGVFPEHTAEEMREWYRPSGPNEELVPESMRGHFHRHLQEVQVL